MKLLVISNMYPSVQKPYTGIFVQNQVQDLRSSLDPDDELDLVAMPRELTSVLGSVRKYLVFLIRLSPYLFRRYDVVHIHYLVPMLIYGWLYKCFHRKSRLVVTLHGTDLMGRLFTGRLNALWRFCSRSVDLGICVGDELRETAVRELRVKRLKTLPVGTSREVFHPDSNIEKVYDFIFIGSLFEYKGADLLQRAISERCRDQMESWVVIGSGPKSTEFQQLAKNGLVTYFSSLPQDEVADMIRRSCWLVAPGRREAFGLAVVEALFCGTPVIASDISAFREKIVPGENGYLHASGNYESLSRCLDEAKEIEDETYSGMCKNAAESNSEYASERTTRNLIDLYRELARR